MALPKTSAQARDILETLRRTGIRPNLWARAALGYSLSLEADPEQEKYDSEGTEFQEKVFFGDDESALLAMLRQRVGRALEPGEIGPMIKAHVERGLRHFDDEYQRLNRRGDELLLYLTSLAAGGDHPVVAPCGDMLPPAPHSDSFAVSVCVGALIADASSAQHVLNGAGGAPHVAIMGRNGTGKTRTGLGLLSQLCHGAGYPVPFLVFDYAKGDIASNRAFVESTDARVVTLPENAIPFAPLALAARDDTAVQLAGRRFRDTICSVVRLGPLQKDRCLQLITRLYASFHGATPDLADLTHLAEHDYEVHDWSGDSLLACLRDFAAFPMFRPAEDGEEHDLFRRPHSIDVHALPEDLRKLSVFLLLDRLYSEIMTLPDAPLDAGGNRQIRLVIVIDEAHHFLPCRQQTLQHMIREVRSKGVAVWLFSQSPDDFDQPKYNFAREMGLALVFSCVVEKPRMLEALLGGKIKPANLSHLGAGVALTRLAGHDAPVEVQAWQA